MGRILKSVGFTVAGVVALALGTFAFADALPTGSPAPAEGRGVHAPDSLVEAVVYTTLRPPNWDVYLFEEPGAAPRPLTDDPSLDYNAVFSPDGRWVVFTSERSGSADLYALDLESGGEPERLTRHSAMEDAASFSPDGGRLAFVSTRAGYADVFVMPFSPGDPAAERRAVNLTRRPGGDFNPAFSPDGRHIAFSRQTCLRAGGGVPSSDGRQNCREIELSVMDADGSNQRTLATARVSIPRGVEYREGVAGSPAWSPDGASIYYYSVYSYYRDPAERAEDEYVEGGEIRRVMPDGSSDIRLIADGYSPAVVPGGRVAFVRPLEEDGPSSYYSGQVFTAAPDGSDPRAVSPLLDSWLDSCFAPDFDRNTGHMVCHRASRSPVAGPELPQGRSFVPPVGIRRVELPDRTVVLRSTGAYFPALTPDGEVVSTLRIRSAFDASEGRSAELTVPLHVSGIDGTELRELFAPSSGIAWGAATAHDAGWVVVAVGPTFGASETDVDIWKVRLDGQGAVNLTPDSPANDAFPSISSDGRRIVFRSGRDGPRGETPRDPPADMAIYVMGGDGEDPHRLTDTDARETMPAISPDGEWVVYVVHEAHSAKLWLSRVDGSERRLLEPERAQIPDRSMHPRFSPDGKWVVFTSNRGGLNDEWPITPQPQPYGDLWAVSVDGGQAVRLTNDKWEDGPSDWGYVRLRNAPATALPAIAPARAKPSIAVIGTGNMGGALGVKLAAAGYPVVYGSRDPTRASVEELVERTGANATAGTQLEAARQGDVIILAVPWEAMEDVVGNLGDVAGKALVDVTYGAHRVGADGYMENIEETSMTERIQSWAPEARAVKVSMPSQYLVDQPDLLGTPPTVMVAADDRAAKEAVARLVADIGLDPFDAGPPRFARSIESFGLLFWVPLLQGRDEGIEFRLMRSSFWPCFWDVQAELGTPDDIDDLAEIPRSDTPRPCDSFDDGGSGTGSDGGG